MMRLPSGTTSSNDIGTLCWKVEQYIVKYGEWSRRSQAVAGASKDVDCEDPAVNELFTLNNIDATDMAVVEKVVKELRTIEREYPEAHFIVPAYPSETERLRILEWLRREISEQLLCSFSVRTDIGGGFVLRTGKRQYDFSVKRRVLDNKSRIKELLTNGK